MAWGLCVRVRTLTLMEGDGEPLRDTLALCYQQTAGRKGRSREIRREAVVTA